jgi:hypothetical protein
MTVKDNVSKEHWAAIEESKSGKTVMFVLLGKDCGDTKEFLKALNAAERAFGNKLTIVRSEGYNAGGTAAGRQEANSKLPGVLIDLAHLKYPKDGRGHFPSGVIYRDGKEIARLPVDSQLAAWGKTPINFCTWVAGHTQLRFNSSALGSERSAT